MEDAEASLGESGGTLAAGYLISDVVNLTGLVNTTGTLTDTFVIEMSYNETLLNGFETAGAANGKIYLAWNNGVEWV